MGVNGGGNTEYFLGTWAKSKDSKCKWTPVTGKKKLYEVEKWLKYKTLKVESFLLFNN